MKRESNSAISTRCISVSNSDCKRKIMHAISSIFLQFRTVQCSMNQIGILWKHRVKFLCNFISAFFRYFSERFAYATILLNAHKSCENWTVYAICSLARTSFRKSFLETRLSPIICYIFLAPNREKEIQKFKVIHPWCWKEALGILRKLPNDHFYDKEVPVIKTDVLIIFYGLWFSN